MKLENSVGTVKPSVINGKHVRITSVLSYIIMCIITVIVFLPIIITVFASFKTAAQIGIDFPLKMPSFSYLENYITVFTRGKILLGFKNSVLIVVVSLVLNTFLGSMTAFTLNRFNFRFKKVIMALFVIGMVIPVYVTEIARFPLLHSLGVYNTMFAPIIIYAATDLMQIYIYTQFVEKISVSLDESAMLDGCSYFGIFFRIIFPLLLPATATLGIIKAVDIMNDMYIPYLYMPSSKLRTMTTTLMDFSSSRAGSWEILSAAIIVVLIPTVFIYIVFQKFIFAGIVAGAVKE
ncbi:carbohydrate ABC transporter permease [Ruminiclostridium cellobioparum]|jgi:raffinose/stachyose/melibiose transport system permease protein|uniref:carbohydrate ABC transporter permease n=1 Tax=Ruminiclostridium cellobioparum TaxID=29355 RepID=UPI0035E41DC6